MKSFLVIATLALASVASATEAPKTQQGKGLVPSPDMNLYAALTPEPSHAMLLMMGVVGLVVRRRR